MKSNVNRFFDFKDIRNLGLKLPANTQFFFIRDSLGGSTDQQLYLLPKTLFTLVIIYESCVYAIKLSNNSNTIGSYKLFCCLRLY